MTTCSLCHLEKGDIFQVDLIADDDTEYQLPVCGTCWDITARIAEQAAIHALGPLQKKFDDMHDLLGSTLAVFNQMLFELDYAKDQAPRSMVVELLDRHYSGLPQPPEDEKTPDQTDDAP